MKPIIHYENRIVADGLRFASHILRVWRILMTKSKGSNKSQGVTNQPKKEEFSRGSRDKPTSTSIGDGVKGKTTTSTGPRDPFKSKK